MRMKISTQPISTSRSPRRGSSPVVSVSRMISRMDPYPAAGESRTPPRHLSSLDEDFPDSCTYRIKSMGRIHHEIGTSALFGIGQLPRQNGIELLARHVVARKNTLALNVRIRGDHHDGIDTLFATGFEQERHIDHRDRCAGTLGVVEELLEVRTQHRMHDLLQALD